MVKILSKTDRTKIPLIFLIYIYGFLRYSVVTRLTISAVVKINSLERDGLRQAELCPRHIMKMKTKNTPIPDVGPQLSRTSLGNVLLKKKRFSADGQNIAQNCTTMRVVETMLYWTAASPRKKICNQSSARKLRLQ